MHLEPRFHGRNVGGVQGQGGIGRHFLDDLDDPGHQLFAALAGRADINVDEINAAFGLFFGHVLERLGVAVLHGLAVIFS